MAEDMLIRNMAIRTIDSYTYNVDRFAKHFGKLPDDLDEKDIHYLGDGGRMAIGQRL